jgi:hypothetical protein
MTYFDHIYPRKSFGVNRHCRELSYIIPFRASPSSSLSP